MPLLSSLLRVFCNSKKSSYQKNIFAYSAVNVKNCPRRGVQIKLILKSLNTSFPCHTMVKNLMHWTDFIRKKSPLCKMLLFGNGSLRASLIQSSILGRKLLPAAAKWCKIISKVAF